MPSRHNESSDPCGKSPRDPQQQAVSHFSATLELLIKQHGLNQTSTGNAAGVGQDMVSRYINADRRPDVATLERLCRVFGDDAPTLLIAFLRDEIPTPYWHHIRLEPATGSIRAMETPPSALDRLDPHTRETIEAIARRCEQRPDFVEALQSLLKITGPQ